MQFGPTVVAPAFQTLGIIAPKAAEAMIAGVDHNKAAWERLGTSEGCSPMSVLPDSDGSERALHVFGGSLLEGDADADICMYAP